MKSNYILYILICYCLSGCKKDFLEAKPSASIVNPTSLSEFRSLLDNSNILNKTGALPMISSDEYSIVNKADFDAFSVQTLKNAYLWQSDVYSGEVNIPDWNQLYSAIFYANNALDGLEKIERLPSNATQWDDLKGAALFYRAFAYFDLTRNFCPVYIPSQAVNDLGLPLRKSAGIDIIEKRSNLEETFSFIITDLVHSVSLLKDDYQAINKNRPSKASVYALLARIYLYMGKYNDAEENADKCITKYSKLIDYNNVSQTSDIPFSYSTDETIFYSTQVVAYSQTTAYTTVATAIKIDPALIALYQPRDLRLNIFFVKNALGNLNVKRGYVGGGFYAFSGLATDEVLLIKAECAARSGRPDITAALLNNLLVNRYQKGTFTPYSNLSSDAALELVLNERRKELVWRALRWSDLKRLNRDGSNIKLERNLGGTTYTLAPNSTKYVFPIPDDEIALSGIQQNVR
ncbi:RagB/SusD family nutrient uptake outer membrane protein [Pedobacter sp. G11]|uniref:RagB/SusD family nutrient uptake outer membrane protein n=1 Tax=Pedobacter sp. G11 TaxID=2482728 RepID=UPI000F5FC9BB|nr:RagB/SusD family nutrient uptake outer membrane protein [Pedobacter sp. G11]AZI24147.1 RagB/SusD family nutrient uptake outer membrane protein [Pedobacter sp. G11]